VPSLLERVEATAQQTNSKDISKTVLPAGESIDDFALRSAKDDKVEIDRNSHKNQFRSIGNHPPSRNRRSRRT
jgi:hypothetical protein